MQRLINVGISDMQVSDNPDVVIATHALGSCIAVIAHDPIRSVGGMLHYQLPSSKKASDNAKENPAKYADTGIPLLFKLMYKFGCKKKDMIVKVAGGGMFCGQNSTFKIGERNFIVLRKIFWNARVLIEAEDVGGDKSRTAFLHVDTGKVRIKSGLEEYEL